MPVLGFLPIFEVFSLILKLPKPLISTFSPFCRDSLMEANTELIINSICFLVILGCSATIFSINTPFYFTFISNSNITDRLRKVK